MDSHTLTFYSISAGLCFGISLFLLGYAQLQRGTVLIRSSALAMLILAVAFYMAGYGALLPTWMMRIVTNMLLLYSSVVLYKGFQSYSYDTPPRFDFVGNGLIALTLPFFIRWGVIEPNGIMRSIVFSLVSAILNGRIAWVLVLLVRSRRGGLPAKLLSGLFILASIWMLARTGILSLTDPVPIEQQGSNPTTWVTVFWFNVLAAAITGTLLAMDMLHHKQYGIPADQHDIESGRSNLILLWTLVLIISLTIIAEVGIAYTVLYQREQHQLQERAQLANQAFVEQTQQVIGQVDMLIRATRGFMARGVSPNELEQYIHSLEFPRDIIENVFVIDANGSVVVPQADRAKGRIATERDYFQFHQIDSDDSLFIGPVSIGQITGKHQFRLSRRISDTSGNFLGVILVPVEPKFFSGLYQRMLGTPDSIVTLVSTADHKIRARSPVVEDLNTFQQPVENTPLWNELSKSSHGVYNNASAIDGIERLFQFQRLNNWPLVMVTGFSSFDVHRFALQSIQPIGLGALLALAALIALATILTGVILRRDEQDRFMSMLSHELKTPMSVIRMTLGLEAMPLTIKQRVSRAVVDMNAIIERCLQSDRLSHGRVVSVAKSCHIGELLDDIRTASIAPERLIIHAESLPTCTTDAQLLGVTLANLIDNALKYSASGEVVTVTAVSESRKGRDGVCVTVRNLIGRTLMPDPKRVFKKYYRGPGSHGKTGSGLGLHIAAGFAKKIGASLRYLPEADEVRFELWVPC